MRAAYLMSLGSHEKRTIGETVIKEVDKPVMQPGEVLVKIVYASICGSDIHTIQGMVTDPARFTPPIRLGHEAAGIIVDVSPEAAALGYKVGDRVTGNYARYCNSCYYCRTGQQNYCQHRVAKMDGMSDYLCWNVDSLYKLPDDVTLKQGVLTEPLTVSLGIVEMSNIKTGTNVCIFGGGAIGQLCLILSLLQGAATVTLVEPVESKRELAKRLGAKYTVDPINENVADLIPKVTDGRGFDAIIDASGAKSAVATFGDLIAKNGWITFGAMYPMEYELPVNLFKTFFEKGAHMGGIFTSANLWPRAVQLLERVDADAILNVYEPEAISTAVEDWIYGRITKATLCFSPEDADK